MAMDGQEGWGKKKSQMTPNIWVTRRVELLLCDTKKTAGGTGLKRTIKSLVGDILSGRCPLNIQADVASRRFHMWVWLQKRSLDWKMNWEVLRTKTGYKSWGIGASRWLSELSVCGANLICRGWENKEESKRHWAGRDKRRKIQNHEKSWRPSEESVLRKRE